MPFWKGKKQESPKQEVMMCPECHSTHLRYATRTGLIMGQPKLLCPDCGYQGFVFVDINPGDTNEDEFDKEFLHDNPEFVASRKPAWQLAEESLQKKWIPDQQFNHSHLREWCSFCEDVEVICSICRCPHEICANHATSGLIGELNSQYDDDVKLSKVDPEIYNKIVKGFQQLVEKKVL